MSKLNDMNNSPKDESKPSFSPRGMLVWVFILGLLFVLLFTKSTGQSRYEVLDYSRFMELIEQSKIVSGEIVYTPGDDLRKITGKYVLQTATEPVTKDFVLSIPLSDTAQDKILSTGKFTTRTESAAFENFLITILPFLLVGLLFYFLLMRKFRSAGQNAANFGRSRARMISKGKNKVKFKDVAGIQEAVEEVTELVDYLKDPKKFQMLGGRIPKGVLLVGAPGTGKTLLARAIAGEADADFFSISGSDFVEMYVGVGASRVRDLFSQAKKHAPSIVFIDEIDAVGRSRGVGVGGGNDEREQTLNALLVEMDGFEAQEGVIVIAATNRADVLDQALMRPGRFDRQVVVALPDVNGREDILKVHANKIKLEESVDLRVIARGTPGYSGAELANLLNEAALLAARSDKQQVGMSELEEARDKVRWGRERRSMALTEEEKRITAWHESGHALLNVLLPHTDPLHKVTIIPRGQALGATMSLPKEDIRNRTKKQMISIITMTMGGRIAEELITDDISTGAAGDIQQATQLARKMVCQWGMSDKLGFVLYGDESEYVLLGRDMMRGKDYSNETAKLIDEEVSRIIGEAYESARGLILQNRDKIKLIATSLLDREVLAGEEVISLIKTGFLPVVTKKTESEQPPKILMDSDCATMA